MISRCSTEQSGGCDQVAQLLAADVGGGGRGDRRTAGRRVGGRPQQRRRPGGTAARARSTGPAATSAHGRARCIAIRFGASSPRTRVTKVRTRVTAGDGHRLGGLAQDGQVGHQRLGQRHRRRGGGEEAGQGDADLDRGQEAVGVTGQAHQPRRPGRALPLQLRELTLTQRDQRHLAAGEGRVDQDQQPDQGEVHPVAVHGSSSGQASRGVRLGLGEEPSQDVREGDHAHQPPPPSRTTARWLLVSRIRASAV